MISFLAVVSPAVAQSSIPNEREILGRFGDFPDRTEIVPFPEGQFELRSEDVVVFVGQENFVREQKSGELESLLAMEFSGAQPRFRSMAWEGDTVYDQWRDFNFGDWNAQLDAVGATVLIAQFGQMEALDGAERLPEFVSAYHRLLDAVSQSVRRIVLVSPMPFEQSKASHGPDLISSNDSVRQYSEAISEIASRYDALFVDLVGLTSRERLTENGVHLNESGLRFVARAIAGELGIEVERRPSEAVRETIVAKNRLWFDCWRPSNWSFVYGDRVSQRYGQGGDSYPSLKNAFEAQLPLMEAADERIYAALEGESPLPLPMGPSEPSRGAVESALTAAAQLDTFEVAEGFSVNLFASEARDIVNPVQVSWDAEGRMWVACSPSYPQSLAGMPPRDYIVVLEDGDRDGIAERSWSFAEGLTMVQGVEPVRDGAYVCDFDRLLFLRDTNGDGKADTTEVVFSGFGVGDTHQLVNSVTLGPDGSVWMSQGLHAISRVETPRGIARMDRAGLWRYWPRQARLESFFGGAMAGANCWGVAFDDYGQVFHKTGDRPEGYWTTPGMVFEFETPMVGSAENPARSTPDSAEQYHGIGDLFQTSPKTTALDIVGTRALPESLQGVAIIGGYFGSVVEAHRFSDDGAGYATTQMPKLIKASNKAFRPVDVSVGPDGAIYIADWYNPIIGHYQASYADPRRDKSHGRIWRIAADGYEPFDYLNLATQSAEELASNLDSSERWIRYQSKRLLFERPTEEAISALDEALTERNSDRFLLEAIGVFQAHEWPRPDLVRRLLDSGDYRIRAYGVRTLGQWSDRIEAAYDWLLEAAKDPNPRARLEAIVAASYLRESRAIEIIAEALSHPRDRFIEYAARQSARSLAPVWESSFRKGTHGLSGDSRGEFFAQLLAESPQPSPLGERIYEKACLACHQPEGKGLPGVYPPLVGSDWVSGDSDRLIKIVLHGLKGEIDVAGERYGAGPLSVPMPAMGGLDNGEIAELLTWMRTEYGGGASPIGAERVSEMRRAHSERTEPWTVEELK